MKFVTLTMVERGEGTFNEDTGETTPSTKPCVINAATIRCFYARRDNAVGTRITFNDGGGFAVTEAVDVVAALVAGGEVAQIAQ